MPKWNKWYADAKEEAAFRYGLKGVPLVAYQDEYVLGNTPVQAAKNIHDQRRALKVGEFKARELDDAS